MNRWLFVWQRLFQLIPILIGITFLSFMLIHIVPGDPVRVILGPKASPQAVAALREHLGLNRSLLVQYLTFVVDLAHGDLGDSIVYRVPTAGLIAERLPATIWLLGYAGVLAVLISLPLATLAAIHRNRLVDHAIRAVPLVGLGMPAFWIGILLIWGLALTVPAFPVGGYGTGLFGHLYSLFLPALTVSIAITPTLIRSLRTSILAVLEADYVVTARSKGLRWRRILVRHVIRNALLPAITVLGINIGFLVSGTVVVEQVFGIPGIGSLMLNAILGRDFPVVQGVTMAFAVMVVIVNLLADLSYVALDPRVRFD